MARALVGNASSPRQVKAAGEMTKREKDRWDSNFRVTLGSPEGRAVLYALLEQCGVWHPVFSENPHRMAWLEGQRNVGLWVLRSIGEIDAIAVQTMTVEAIQRLNNRAEIPARTDEPLEDEENAD